MIKTIRKKWRPELFQGSLRRRNYFEGWYYKMVTANEEMSLAVIPGVATGAASRDAQAFVQILDGRTGSTWYIPYDVEEFSYSDVALDGMVGPNSFSKDAIRLDIAENEITLQGEVRMRGLSTLRPRMLRPGIMGWYSFVPFMECYHGLVSMNHELEGSLTMNGQTFRFDGGRGYIEKDWGTSMPSSWIWMQSNHFSQPGISFMASVARIPWLGSAFTGFLAPLLFDDEIHIFATYTGAKLIEVSFTAKSATLVLEDRKYRLHVHASRERTNSGLLQAPVAGNMERRIGESLDARIEMRLEERNGILIYEGTGSSAGFEMVGDLSELI